MWHNSHESHGFVSLSELKHYIEHLSNSSYRFVEESYIAKMIVIELSPSHLPNKYSIVLTTAQVEFYWKLPVSSSHYYLFSAFNNANDVKAALHQPDIKLDVFISSLQYLDGEIVCRNSVFLLWPDKISSLNLGCSRVRLCKGLICFLCLVPMASRRQGLHWGSVSGAHLVVLVSADVQGCRGHL